MEIHDDWYLFQSFVTSRKVTSKSIHSDRAASVRTETVPKKQYITYYRVNVIRMDCCWLRLNLSQAVIYEEVISQSSGQGLCAFE